MTLFDTKPKPKIRPEPLPRLIIKCTSKEYLPFIKDPATPEFTQVLRSRRSRRQFGRVSAQHLSLLLHLSAKTVNGIKSESGYSWEHKNSPSAGGLHPIHIVIYRDNRVGIYDSVAHAIYQLDEVDKSLLESFAVSLNEIVRIDRGTVVWFAADIAKTLANYEDGETLVWRDAGAMLATVSLAAEALNLNCCSLGSTGEPFISQIIPSNRSLYGVGGLIVGSRE
jgi:SagB-type dehydrogenase family enzyme